MFRLSTFLFSLLMLIIFFAFFATGFLLGDFSYNFYDHRHKLMKIIDVMDKCIIINPDKEK